MTKDEAMKFFASLFGGEHHIASGYPKPFGDGFCVRIYNCISSYDGDMLTRVVLLAHKMRFRAEISASGNSLVLAIHKRKAIGGIFEMHPSLKEHLEELGYSEEVGNDNARIEK